MARMLKTGNGARRTRCVGRLGGAWYLQRGWYRILGRMFGAVVAFVACEDLKEGTVVGILL